VTDRPTLLAERTELTIRTLSDWHIGAGHGIPGGPDAVVRRDDDGLPYVPGTTLTGLLRDACLTVAVALDDGVDGGVWQRWHRVIFGESGTAGRPAAGRRLAPAAVVVGTARLPERLRAVVGADEALVAACVTLRAGVRIDEETGRAQDKMLRFVELARGGLPLRAELTVAADPAELLDEARTAVTALVVLGAAWCDRMGGDRRRGPGEVRLELGRHRAPEWAGWLAESGWMPPEPSPRAAPEPETVEDPATLRGPGWTALDLVITTLAPVRVPSSAAGNVVRGHDYLPGSLLLAWLSQRCGADLIRAAVAAEAVLVRNAYPEVAGRRGLPVPLTVFRPKGGAPVLMLGIPEPGQQQVRAGWTVPDPADGALTLQGRSTAQVSHNQVDRSRQRPTAATGIYELEVIPAERRLRGRVLLTDELASRLRAVHGEQWWQVLAGPARFGARRGGEYGACEVTVGAPTPVVVPDPATGRCTLWVVSDVLVRGRGLRLSADPDDLARALVRQLAAPVTIEAVTARTRRRDGWQGRWQLPRESLIGIGAGSVTRLVVPDGVSIDPDRWRNLMLRGVGERCVEGYGELRVDAGVFAADTWTANDAEPSRYPASAPSGELDTAEARALDLLQTVVRRDGTVSAVAAARGRGAHQELRTVLGELSRSQRGTWRAVTADGSAAGTTIRVDEHAKGWLATKSDKRRNQRDVAHAVIRLLGGREGEPWPIDELTAGRGVATDSDRAFALAALVADVVDALAREERTR